MADRGVENNFRRSTQVVPEKEFIDTSTPIEQTFAEIGQQIIRTNQEAKINENFSQAQIELNRLNRDFQIQYEGDPFNKKGLEKLRSDRDAIFERYGSEISPFFKKPWQDSVRDLATKDDAQTEVWGFAQTKKNTRASINRSIKNNLSQAAIDGANFGNSDQDEIGSMLNFSTSKQKLIDFGDRNLGTETTTNLLESYDDDYLKSFLSGVSDSNPIKALRLIEKDEVKDKFLDKRQYNDMKDAIEKRALNVDKITQQNEILGVLKNENSLLAKSIESNLSYVELQQAFTNEGISKNAQKYFLRANGFTSADGKSSLSTDEKFQIENDLYDDIVRLQLEEDPSAEQIAEMQDKIYGALNSKAITQEKGLDFLNGLLSPAAKKKADRLSQFDIGEKSRVGAEFTVNRLFGSDKGLGFSGLQETLNSSLISDQDPNDKKKKRKLSKREQRFNNERKIELYDNYFEELRKAANVRGISVEELKDLPRSERRKVYNDAQNEAKYNYWSAQYPELGGVPKEKFPAAIVTNDGRKVKTGLVNDGNQSVSAPRSLHEFSSEAEMEAAGLEDGTPVILNGVRGVYRK